jgi:hypothetical protein
VAIFLIILTVFFLCATGRRSRPWRQRRGRSTPSLGFLLRVEERFGIPAFLVTFDGISWYLGHSKRHFLSQKSRVMHLESRLVQLEFLVRMIETLLRSEAFDDPRFHRDDGRLTTVLHFLC